MKRPPATHEFAGIAAIAEQLRDARAAGDQRLVAEDKMTATDATDRLRIASALAADWRRVVNRAPRPERTATDAEILAMLKQALPAAISRRDRAHQALVNNAPQYRRYKTAELWALSDRIGAFSEGVQDDIVEYVRPLLNAESVAAGLAAMLWWHQRTGTDCIHWLTDATIELRAARLAEGEGRLAA
ncbi:hypothetical protein [Sphingomonas sp. RIT328]|uniref:hypothetical protein n=1 Tax=Sphingomonas sp. RIT328 TaxID=1470591 RepID=UPI00044B0506|nr:hypothetical protein [Sphingomonas sp. RIT328]EZP57462.1 hypothetical protein BW41_00307 [Sphingomonas sp. RIT328]